MGNRFETVLADLLRGRPEVVNVETFDEIQFYKRVGLKVTFADGTVVYAQHIRASPPGVPDDPAELYKQPAGRTNLS